MTDLLPDAPKGPNYDEIVAWLSLKTGGKLAAQRRMVGLWVKQHGYPKVLDAYLVAKQSDPVYPIGYIGAILAGKIAAQELGAQAPVRAGYTPSEPNPPVWLRTREIIRVRDDLIARWRESESAFLFQLSDVEKYAVESIARDAAWILAQSQLKDGIARQLVLNDSDYATAKGRARSQI